MKHISIQYALTIKPSFCRVMCKHPTINHDLFLEHNRLLLLVCTQYDNRERELKFNMLRGCVLDADIFQFLKLFCLKINLAIPSCFCNISQLKKDTLLEIRRKKLNKAINKIEFFYKPI